MYKTEAEEDDLDCRHVARLDTSLRTSRHYQQAGTTVESSETKTDGRHPIISSNITQLVSKKIGIYGFIGITFTMPPSSNFIYSPVGQSQSSQKMTTIEDIYDRIGGMGKFQIMAIVLLYGTMIVQSFNMMLMVYAGYIGTFECVTHSEFNQTMSEFYTNVSVSMATRDPDVDKETSLNACSMNGTRCQDFKFLESKKTAVTEVGLGGAYVDIYRRTWHLVCDRLWLKATITSAQMFGVMLGSVLSGLSGDYFGRKKSTYAALFLQAGLNVIAAFSSTWQMFIALRFLIGITIGQGLVMIVPYPTEFLPKRWRHILPLMPLWQLGVMIMAATAWWLEDWSHLHVACAVITFVFTLGCFYVPESPRWLATQGKVEESYSALEKIARVNKKRLPSGVTEILLKISKNNVEDQRGNKYTYLDLFKTKKNIKLTLVFALQWITMSVIYYGINFAVNSFVGNLYLNILIMNSLQLPCLLITIPVVDRLGRRLACVIFMGIVVLTSFICVVLCVSASEHSRDVWISRLGHVSTLFVASCWGASKLWVAESYPTVTRSLGYAFANFGSRVGGVLAPFLLNLSIKYPHQKLVKAELETQNIWGPLVE
ncbi:solute carrier family 22 member 21 [Plakobranchus ocellatus]|uniref:Solute carrier family 22 member 21 n=1 Tax=Plakobranchus ocellatus TaxID=259542 RepID=A0AAV4AZN2_9GAST|nr:solute carrier family 22 member 21 [Plakobranchus ocellatus]